MADNLDRFALGGEQRDDGDDEILALFRQWIAECHIADAAEREAPAWNEALDRGYEIERRIASCRCGPAGLAVKTFILLRSQCSEWVPSLAQIRCEDLFRAGDPGWNACFTASILRDAALLVPEIGECAAAIVHEDAALIDADMGIGSCYERLGTEPGAQVQNTRDKRMALIIRAKLAALLGRIARTEASTPRGEAIKARHAGRDG